MSKHSSDSEVQQRAEGQLVGALASTLGISLQSARLEFGDCSVQVDGWNEEHQVVCEAFARLGTLKPGQKRKLSSDLLKLLLVERARGGNWRRIVVVAGEGAVSWLSGGSWQARVVRDFGIEVFRVPIQHALAVEILQSQVEQVMVNAS